MFNDTLFLFVLFLIYNGYRNLSSVFAAIATYFDPRVLLIVFPLNIIATRVIGKHNIWMSLVMQTIYIALTWYFLATATQLQNTYNILMVNVTSENIGTFWYIMLEMFKSKVEFMKYLFILEAAVMYILCSIHL